MSSTETPDLGYQIFDLDYPAPLPSTNQEGFFGPLFGISFKDPKSTKQLVRAISIAEYFSAFGYDPSFNTSVCKTLQNPCLLRQTLPARTMTVVATKLQEMVASPTNEILAMQSEQYNIDLSIPALFSGIIATDLQQDESWEAAYQSDDNCRRIIQMLKNPSLVTTAKLNTIDSIYRPAMRDSRIRFINKWLQLFEPIASSMKQLQLVIVPSDLQQHIFTSFHVNPLGGHLSLYYTLHKIRLRFHWPHMYKYIK
jgi:hypothetical protein